MQLGVVSSGVVWLFLTKLNAGGALFGLLCLNIINLYRQFNKKNVAAWPATWLVFLEQLWHQFPPRAPSTSPESSMHPRPRWHDWCFTSAEAYPHWTPVEAMTGWQVKPMGREKAVALKATLGDANCLLVTQALWLHWWSNLQSAWSWILQHPILFPSIQIYFQRHTALIHTVATATSRFHEFSILPNKLQPTFCRSAPLPAAQEQLLQEEVQRSPIDRTLPISTSWKCHHKRNTKVHYNMLQHCWIVNCILMFYIHKIKFLKK